MKTEANVKATATATIANNFDANPNTGNAKKEMSMSKVRFFKS